jgi:mono/diheme cytochrome c family protein
MIGTVSRRLEMAWYQIGIATASIGLLGWSSAVAQTIAPATLIDYATSIEPLFRDRCSVCHGSAQQAGGLRLDRKDSAMRGGYSGAVIIPGNSQESKLVRLIAGGGKTVMPPVGQRLTPSEVDLIRAWIDQGAHWQETSDDPVSRRRRTSSHWSFQPLRRPNLPDVRDTAWAKNPIDFFVLAGLEKAGVKPSPRADPRTLRRRFYLDLTGLPPPHASEVVKADDALIDRLMASPQFGEKWVRHWLDLARYADSDGYEQDQIRRNAWRYREWVIRAFNANMPFDRFTIEQLAGDLVPNPDVNQLIATGFHRNTLTSREGGVDVQQLRAEQVADRAGATASVWLGLTMECARCHDHKFDPISQRDFYSLYAFFDNAVEVNPIAPLPGEEASYTQSRPEFEKKLTAIQQKYKVAALMPEWEEEVRAAIQNPDAKLHWTQVADYVRVYVDDGHDILRKAPAQRTYREKLALLRVFLKYPGPLASEPLAKNVRFSEGFNEFEKLAAEYPPLSEAPALQERATPLKTYVHLRGDFRNPGIEVRPATPEVLPAPPEGAPANRLTLARWLVSPENPLTARVFVNRIWQELFGAGIVVTSEDFGLRGDAPTHPALLDWLAADFVESGWDVKRLIRTIVSSATYQQSSRIREELGERDPSNTLLARQSRFRLPAELIRDAALSASGLLNTTIGGPSVRPPMPSGVLEVAYRAKWEESKGPDRYRRGIYTLLQRSVPYPQLANFDAPGSLVSCSRRTTSTTPLQSLNLLNDPVFVEAAEALAAKVIREARASTESRLRYAFETALGRPPAPDESHWLREYFTRTLATSGSDSAALTAAMSVLLNLDEFITRE